MNFLCAANQISKSSTQIRKAIHWATDTTLWESLWGRAPVQFWYLYPSRDVATAEWDTKWSQFMPKGIFKDHPVYGWKEKRDKEGIKWVKFNSGVFIFFKTYAQDVKQLQTGTCDAIFCDEELPEDHYDELIFRISASNGYFHMVFTATLGQEFWRQVMEPESADKERLPEARKWCVSLYQCKVYEDGTPTLWTDERIAVVKARCKNQNEILRRVYGRFVYDSGGKKYEQFDIKRHMVAAHPLPKTWLIYAGVDVGSGGKKNHPGAIVFIAVAPDYRRGRVFLSWRGDGITTTAEDVFNKYNELVAEYGLIVTQAFYDHANKDFQIIQSRSGGCFQPADKSHDTGEYTINVLFKNDILLIQDTEDNQKLATELISLRKDQPKNKAKDDLCDGLRYGVTKIPWDWEVITGEAPAESVDKILKPETELEYQIREINERRKDMDEKAEDEWAQTVADEFSEWNEASGN